MRRRRLILALVAGLLLFAALALFRPDMPLAELKEKYAPPPSQFMNIAGMNVHYRDEGSGIPLVLLHGTGASLHTWQQWAESLVDSFRIIRMDLPGFGLTGPHPLRDYHIETYVNFLDIFLQALDVDTFCLAGNSLGGRIAWGYALAHPQRVKKLVLVDPAGFPVNKESPLVFRLAAVPVLRNMLTYMALRGVVAKSLRDVYADPGKVTDALIDRYYELSLRPGNRQAFVDRANTSYVDRTGELQNLTMPTLIMWGEQDRWIPVEHARRYRSAIPDARVIIYPDAGHVPMEEIPRQSANDLRIFLNANGKGLGKE